MDNENKPLSHREFAKQYPPLPPQGCCPADEEIARLEKEFFEPEPWALPLPASLPKLSRKAKKAAAKEEQQQWDDFQLLRNVPQEQPEQYLDGEEKILSDGMMTPAGKARLSQNTAIPTSGLDYSDLPLFPDVLPCIVALQKAKASTEKKPG